MGNTFKEQVYDDFKNTLLSVGEYGRVCSWNGYPLQILELPQGENQDAYAQGVNMDTKVVVCRDIDINPVPKAEEQIELDGEIWYVSTVKQVFCRVEILLERKVI